MREPYVISGDLSTDERGVVRYVNGFNFCGVKRFYTIENHEVGYVRAWHGHWSEEKYIYVASGTAIIGVANMVTKEAQRFVLSSEEPGVLYVPPGYANGCCALKTNTVIVHFSTRTLEESHVDDVRYGLSEFEDIWRIEPR